MVATRASQLTECAGPDGFCARADTDPVFDRECFSTSGESFNADPVAASAESVESGKALYAKNCRFCHGPEAKGNGPLAPKGSMPSDLTDAKWDHGGTDGEIAWSSDGTALYFVRHRDAVGGRRNPNGTYTHLTTELFKSLTGADLTHIPYKGTPQALTDTMAGQLQLSVLVATAVIPSLKGGKIRALGVTSARRSPLLPDVPTLAESGIKDAESLVWFGMTAPLKTTRPIIEKLNREVNRVLTLADVKARLDQLGLEIQGGTPEDMDKFVRGETAKLKQLIKAGLLRPE